MMEMDDELSLECCMLQMLEVVKTVTKNPFSSINSLLSLRQMEWQSTTHPCHIEPPCLTNTFKLCDLKNLYVTIITCSSEDAIIQVGDSIEWFRNLSWAHSNHLSCSQCVV
jgi:hypothetical protein